MSKNDPYRKQLQRLNKLLKFKYVLNDLWYRSAENMMFVKRELHKDFMMGLKSYRHVYLRLSDKAKDNYVVASILAFIMLQLLKVN